VRDHLPGNKGTSCSRNVRRSRPCLHGLLSGQKEVSHNNRRKCKGSARSEGTRVEVRVCRCALSPRSRLTLVSLLSHPRRPLIPLISLSSHSHLTLVALSSHSHLTLISLSSHSHLTIIALASRSHGALISLSSHFGRSFISFSSHSHLIPISLSSRSHRIMACSFIAWGVVWVMAHTRNTQIHVFNKDNWHGQNPNVL
jgi:hypothetical protein